MNRLPGWRVAVAAVLAVATPACAARSAAAPLPPDPPAVTVDMREYAFSPVKPLPAGRVVVTARNVGSVDHELVVVELPDDLAGTIADQLRSPDRRAIPTVVALTARPPGSASKFALDLAPGRYALLCLLKEPGAEAEHALEGMSAELRVHGPVESSS